MVRARGTTLGGVGVALVSTFAPALGLSVQVQRVGFGVGVLIMLAGGVLFVHDLAKERAAKALEQAQAASREQIERQQSTGAGRLSDEPPASPVQECPTPMDMLRDGIRLQSSSKLTDAEVLPWAKHARLSVELRDPLLVKDFYRTFRLHRQDYFNVAYAIEAREEGLRSYLDRRVEIVEKAVEATRSGTVSS